MIGGQWAPALTIDSLGLDRVGLIKIDVEGAEHDVIRGAAQTIARLPSGGGGRRRPRGTRADRAVQALGMAEVSRHRIGPNLAVENVVLSWPPAPN